VRAVPGSTSIINAPSEMVMLFPSPRGIVKVEIPREVTVCERPPASMLWRNVSAASFSNWVFLLRNSGGREVTVAFALLPEYETFIRADAADAAITVRVMVEPPVNVIACVLPLKVAEREPLRVVLYFMDSPFANFNKGVCAGAKAVMAAIAIGVNML